MEEVRAYAKIVGPGWVYYMTKPKIILGRGGENLDCDVIISTESAVSRQHFTVRFAPEVQAFEVHNLSKNGILVNGEFMRRLGPPLLLRSQADIMYGRKDPMRLTFLLPSGSKTSVKKREPASGRNVPLLQWIGEVLVMHNRLPANRIRGEIEKEHPDQLQKLGTEGMIEGSIRHLLGQNDHIFHVVPLVGDVDESGASSSRHVPVPPMASFAVRDEHVSRFLAPLTDLERDNHKRTVCRDKSCITARYTPVPQGT